MEPLLVAKSEEKALSDSQTRWQIGLLGMKNN